MRPWLPEEEEEALLDKEEKDEDDTEDRLLRLRLLDPRCCSVEGIVMVLAALTTRTSSEQLMSLFDDAVKRSIAHRIGEMGSSKEEPTIIVGGCGGGSGAATTR